MLSSYQGRSAILHTVAFIFVALSFIFPVVLGTSALLPTWLSGIVSILVALAILVDAAHKAFAPPERPARGLRALSALAALTALIGWICWLFIFNNFDAAGTTMYKIGTFTLGTSAVLNIFCAAIAFMDSRAGRVTPVKN